MVAVAAPYAPLVRRPALPGLRVLEGEVQWLIDTLPHYGQFGR